MTLISVVFITLHEHTRLQTLIWHSKAKWIGVDIFRAELSISVHYLGHQFHVSFLSVITISCFILCAYMQNKCGFWCTAKSKLLSGGDTRIRCKQHDSTSSLIRVLPTSKCKQHCRWWQWDLSLSKEPNNNECTANIHIYLWIGYYCVLLTLWPVQDQENFKKFYPLLESENSADSALDKSKQDALLP